MARITRAKTHLDLLAAATARNSGVAAHKLPYELVLYTLQLALASLDNYGARVRFLRSITAVSTWWRTLALTMPELWSEIVYSRRFDTTDVKKFGVVFRRTKTFLERSKNSPISVSIITQGTTLKEIHRLLQFIIPYLPRCRSLSLELGDAELVEQYLPLQGPLPLLTEVHIGAWRSFRLSPQEDHRVLVFDEKVAPPIRDLHLMSNNAFIFSHLPTIALKRVYVGGANPWAEITRFLAQCPDLEDLTLGFLRMPDDDEVEALADYTNEARPLSRLRCLTLNGHRAMTLAVFLRMPDLERLTLDGKMEIESMFDDSPFTPPAPPFHTLRLRNCNFSRPPDALESPLSAFQVHYENITTLELESCDFVSHMICTLADNVLPRLESLRICVDWRQLEKLVLSLKALLDKRPTLRLALKCKDRRRGSKTWGRVYGLLKEWHGERFTYWDMQPHTHS